MQKSCFEYVLLVFLHCFAIVNAFPSPLQQTTSTSDGCKQLRLSADVSVILCPDGKEWRRASSSGEPQSNETVDELTDVASKTRLLLFTSSNRDVAQEMNVSDERTIGPFVGSKATKIVVHGFDGSVATTQWLIDMKDAFLDKEDVNVVLVDWGELAKAPDYSRAVQNTKLVGAYIATLIDWLNRSEGSSSENYHLIGFSLGAHVVGFAGKDVATGKLARITGLDPAYPLYEVVDSSGRLASTDAEFVDVIHTNSGPLLEGGLSFMEPLGDLDFYPNGGRRQPECRNLLESIIDIFTGGFDVACSHNRAPQLFLESIENPLAFPGYPCRDYFSYTRGICTTCEADPSSTSGNECLRMGVNAVKLAANASDTAIFYLSTRATRPYHGTPFFFQMSTSAHQVPTKGWVHVNLTGSSGSFMGAMSDCPLLFNEEQEIGTGVKMFAARNILPELNHLEIGSFNFTQHDGGDRMTVDGIKMFLKSENTSVCFNDPLVVMNDMLVDVNFTTCS